MLILALFLAAAIPVWSFPNPQRNVYVATAGSDVSGDGTSGSPWATIDHACAYLASAGRTSDTTINLASGHYYGTASTIGTACSGTQYHPLTISAASVDSAVLVGGQAFSGSTCSVYSGSVYRCPVPGTANFWTAFEGTTRLTWARTPNLSINASWPRSFEPVFYSANGGSYTSRPYVSTDFNPATWSVAQGDVYIWLWEGNGVIEPGMQWFSGLQQVTSIDTSGHIIHYAQNTKYDSGALGGIGYFMVGDLTMVDQSGEWYLDRNDVHGAAPGGQHYFYVQPINTPISGETFTYPTTSDTLTMAGTDQTHPVHDVVVRNLSIGVSDHTNWYRYAIWGTGRVGDFDPTACDPYPAGDCGMAFEAAQPNVRHALVHASNVQRVIFDRVHLFDGGMKGFYCEQLCEGVSLQNSLVEHIADDAVDFEGLFCGQGDVNNNNAVYNNKIHDMGEMVGHGEGIRFANSGHNVDSHNDISQGPRGGIYITDLETPGMANGYAIGNLSTYEHLSYLDQDSNDNGAWDIFGVGSLTAPFRTNEVSQLGIDHITTDTRMNGFGVVDPSCIDFDNQTHGQIVHDISCTNSTKQYTIASDTGNLTENNGSVDHRVWDVSWGATGGGGTDLAHAGIVAGNPY